MADIKRLDPQDMYGKIYDFPTQLREGYFLPIIAGQAEIDPAAIKAIVVAGMGGSAIGGDILRSYLAYDLRIPIFVNRNYRLPCWIDKSSLVIASSYSGNTEETLAAFAQAREADATIMVSTTGGKLAEEARALDCHRAMLPTGFQPRAALGYSFGPLLHFLVEYGFVDNQEETINATCDFLVENRKSFVVEQPTSDNQAKQIAARLYGKIVLIYAGADYYDTTAVRFKGQICENAQQMAFANVCPELNHNEIVGFDFPDWLTDKSVVVFLTGSGDSDSVTARFQITSDILKAKGVETIFIEAGGPNRLAEIFSLVQIGDFVSFYLALLNRVDPSPVAVIDQLKTELEKLH
ncbi:MAG: bifunctional phosphoglucose/phosphomannose isomerase [candidate division Zixibacteria bacterium]|nr:bifunctional phosphoglucose/phosphomannose isomerase [candidate division Zixibacteria bacterium]